MLDPASILPLQALYSFFEKGYLYLNNYDDIIKTFAIGHIKRPCDLFILFMNYIDYGNTNKDDDYALIWEYAANLSLQDNDENDEVSKTIYRKVSKRIWWRRLFGMVQISTVHSINRLHVLVNQAIVISRVFTPRHPFLLHLHRHLHSSLKLEENKTKTIDELRCRLALVFISSDEDNRPLHAGHSLPLSPFQQRLLLVTSTTTPQSSSSHTATISSSIIPSILDRSVIL